MEAAKHDKRTVFVRGIAFSTGPEDFEAFFSELGPVRTSFLVKDKGQTGHKGFGFVQFALPEDAHKAAEQLHNTEFQGRKIKVEPAVKRAPLVERKKRKLGDRDGSAQPGTVAKPATDETAAESQQPSAAKVQRTEAASKPPKLSARASKKARKQKEGSKSAANPKQQLVRTVALGNLKPDTKAQAIALAQAAGTVKSIADPPSDLDISHARLKQDGCTGLVVFIVYDSVKVALAAVAKLHGQSLGQPTKKAAKRQKVDRDGADAAQQSLWARQVSGEGLHLKKWRLILRNLSFQVKQADLKAALQAGGSFVWDLSLPKSSEGSLKGFGFATFMTRGHAESAIKTTNGKVVAGRQVVVDWAMAKARFTDAQASGSPIEPEPMQIADAATIPDTGLNGKVVEPVEEDGEEGEGAPDDPDAEHKMIQGVLESLLQDDEDADQPAQVKPSGKPEEPKAAKQKSVSRADTTVDSQAEAQQAAVQKLETNAIQKPGPTKNSQDKQQAARDSSKTVFVRSLPPDVSQDQLNLAFTKFGKLRACRLVMNKASQQPKGTAFVEYWDIQAAAAAAAACQKAREGGAGGIMVGGRTVEVDLALSQDDARNLASGGRSTAAGKDNRNLYLAKEGTIEEGSAAWDSLSVTDRTKRKRAAEEKNTKLRSPNFSVSRTRLSVRNIPLTMQEKALKQLFITAVKEHASMAHPQVKQAKILRDPERVDPTDGLPRSRGLGFVEFTEHEHAICALRQLNNNPAPFGREKRPIVEFALESAQAVRKMATKQAWQKSQAQDKQQAKPAIVGEQPGAGAGAPAVASRKARQLAKKQAQVEGGVRQSKGKATGKSADGKAVGTRSQTHAMAKQAMQPSVKPEPRNPRKAAKQIQGPDKPSVDRKRKADAVLDDLASHLSQGKQQQGSVKKSRPGKAEKGDKLDDMVANYKAKYFGGQLQAGPGRTAPKQANKQPAAGFSRWFE
ncbi:hypothetical protein WJX79_009181 [Trebouxia sp. C0005]